MNLDIFLPAKNFNSGNLHPISIVSQKIMHILRLLSYQQVDVTEIENEDYNFNYLNIPYDHPARNKQDTFYLDKNLLLRTHTSNTQIRILEKFPNCEIKFFSIGKVYRRDEDDATHIHQFNQLEVVAVGQKISLVNLKNTLEFLLTEFFEKKHLIRFRSSYFPFTEPSFEVDICCFKCEGKGCLICKKTGWVEILGAGLIHPQVLINCKYDINNFSGFAFGIGLERLLMIKYGINDIRDIYNNNLYFLNQFAYE